MKLPWRQRRKRAVVRRTARAGTADHSVRRQILIGVLLVIGISLLLTGIYHLTRLSGWQITQVSVVGGTTIPAAEVEGVVWESLTGTYYRLIPKTFSPLYPKQGVTERLRQIERINHIELDRQGRQKLVVVFDEYVPTGLWCETATSTDCLFIDQTGYAFGSAPRLEGSSFVRFIDDGTEPTKAAAVFASDFMRTQREFIDLLEHELNLFVTHVIVIGDFDIEYVIAGGGRLKVSQTQSLQSSLSNLESILASPEFTHLRDGDFQYIDLRFGDRVFVNETFDTTPTSTATST